jgi:leucyl aminopeptidase
MNIGLNSFNLDQADSIIINVYDSIDIISVPYISQVFENLKKKEKFKGDCGELFFTSVNYQNGLQDIIFIGLGKQENLSSEAIRTAYAKAIKKCKELKSKKIYLEVIKSDKLSANLITKSIVEGLFFGDYKFDKYKSDKKIHDEIDISMDVPDNALRPQVEEGLSEAIILTETTILARNLVNEPANVLYPESLAVAAQENGRKYNFEVEVFNRLQIEELGMKAFLSVSLGSSREPRLIVMRYNGNEHNKSEVLGLVGKGLTYDSGGYSLKSNEGMVTMKCDMGGAASVIGAMCAIAARKLKINVVGVIAACENLISGKAYKPGDIIGSMAGKTIEVLNTDAEGRLTLVDAVHYVITKENATRVVDVATLTGAALVALGTTSTAVISNNNDFYRELEKASSECDEKVWLLPSFEEYKKLIKSELADLKNIGGKNAGTITAGLFIGEFVQDKPWLHLDIAGTAFTDTEKDYYSKGGTGVGVRTLYYLARNCK